MPLSAGGRRHQAALGDPRQARPTARNAWMRVPGGTRPRGAGRVGRWVSVRHRRGGGHGGRDVELGIAWEGRSPWRRTKGPASRRDRPGEVGTSRRGAIPSSCSAQLRAPSAVPPARPRRRSGPGQRHRRAARARDREHGSGGARRAAAPRAPSGSASTLGTGFRSPVAAESAPARRTRCSARSPLSRRRGGGCGTRCRGKAGETSTRWRSRPTGIAVAIETKTRTYDAAPSRSGARAGGLAVAAPAKMGTQRRPWRHVPRPRAGRRARRARRSGGLDRPVDACPSRRGGDGSGRAFSG